MSDGKTYFHDESWRCSECNRPAVSDGYNRWPDCDCAGAYGNANLVRGDRPGWTNNTARDRVIGALLSAFGAAAAAGGVALGGVDGLRIGGAAALVLIGVGLLIGGAVFIATAGDE